MWVEHTPPKKLKGNTRKQKERKLDYAPLQARALANLTEEQRKRYDAHLNKKARHAVMSSEKHKQAAAPQRGEGGGGGDKVRNQKAVSVAFGGVDMGAAGTLHSHGFFGHGQIIGIGTWICLYGCMDVCI